MQSLLTLHVHSAPAYDNLSFRLMPTSSGQKNGAHPAGTPMQDSTPDVRQRTMTSGSCDNYMQRPRSQTDHTIAEDGAARGKAAIGQLLVQMLFEKRLWHAVALRS